MSTIFVTFLQMHKQHWAIPWMNKHFRLQTTKHPSVSSFIILNSDKWDNVIKKWLYLTHWGRVTHICISELTIIASDNGLSPGRRQAIIWNKAGLLLIEPLGTNFSEISIGIQTFSFKKMHLNMSSAKWRPFCLGLNVLTHCGLVTPCSNIERGQHWPM